jgi:ABC-type Fe3+/spermidine/putrescine transport system ATPase subunit
LLLLDEPLAALDAPVRTDLRRHLRALQHELAATTIVVTHDPEEAAMLADELLVLDRGRIVQAGPTREVLDRPASPHVARLLGMPNIHEGHAAERGLIETDGIRIPVSGPPLDPGRPLTWSVRPDAIRVVPDGPLEATVLDVVDLPSLREAVLQLSPAVTLVLRNPDRNLAAGTRCSIAIPPDAVRTWVDGAGAAAPERSAVSR